MKRITPVGDGFGSYEFDEEAGAFTRHLEPLVTDATREHEREQSSQYAHRCDAWRESVKSALDWHLNYGADESWEAVY